MNQKPNDGGPAFPLPITKDHLGVVITTAELNTEKCGMTLRDWFASQEKLSDLDDPDAIASKEMCVKLAGPQPTGGWKDGNMLEMYQWESKWRAALKYLRADAMIAERNKSNP